MNRARFWKPLLALCLLATTGACAGSGSSLRVTSLEQDSMLAPGFNTVVFVSEDKNVADIYITDLPRSVWQDGGGVAIPDGVSGSAIHIHQFYRPHVTRTPIATSASNLTIQMLVISGDQVGLYGGGGFLLPKGSATNNRYGGQIRDASLRLLNATPGFADLLGASELNGRISARKDPEYAEDLALWFTRTASRLDQGDIAE